MTAHSRRRRFRNTLRSWTFAALDRAGTSLALKIKRVRHTQVAVLTFHRVSDEPNPLWPPMRVEVFRRLIRFLAQETLVVPVENLSLIQHHPSKPVVSITFDDGYEDFYENALPILREHGLPCNQNVCAALVDRNEPTWQQVLMAYLTENSGREVVFPGCRVAVPAHPAEADYLRCIDGLYTLPYTTRDRVVRQMRSQLQQEVVGEMMTWAQIRSCQAAGVTIGSHGMWHNILPSLNDESLLQSEIVGSADRIEHETGERPRVFAFPSGFHDERSIQLVRAAGYRVALLCEDKAFRIPLGPTSQEFSALTRINMADASYSEEKSRALGFHAIGRDLLKNFRNCVGST